MTHRGPRSSPGQYKDSQIPLLCLFFWTNLPAMLWTPKCWWRAIRRCIVCRLYHFNRISAWIGKRRFRRIWCIYCSCMIYLHLFVVTDGSLSTPKTRRHRIYRNVACHHFLKFQNTLAFIKLVFTDGICTFVYINWVFLLFCPLLMNGALKRTFPQSLKVTVFLWLT